MKSSFWPALFAVSLIALACRENIVGSADAEKERLILGTWTLSHVEPPISQTVHITLTFRQDFTLRIQTVTSDSSSDSEFGYIIADGQVSYFVDDAEGLLGIIESINEFNLVLLVPTGLGYNLRETFNRDL